MRRVDKIWSRAWKNKKTGEYITVSGISYGTKIKIKYYDSTGLSYELSENSFFENYIEGESRENLFKNLGPSLIEACLGSTEYMKLGNALLRRLEPGYFKLGDIVYFENPCGYFKEVHQNYGMYEYGVECPYKIISYNPHRDSESIMLLGLVRLGKKEDSNPDFEIPVYLDRIEPGDAFHCLSRYDKPF